MPTETLQCKDCPNTFEFTEGEQKFFAEKGFSKPIRCKSCRDKRKAEKNQNNTAPHDHDNPPKRAVQWTNGDEEPQHSIRRSPRGGGRGERRHRDDY